MSNFFSFSSLFSGLSLKYFLNYILANLQFRSSRWRCSVKKVFLKISQDLQKKHLCWRPFGFLKLTLQILKIGIYMRVSENLKVFILKSFTWKTKISTIQSKSFCHATFKKLMIYSFSFYIFFYINMFMFW